MAKHRNPLQSGQVSGKMDESRVFATLHGRTYSKRYVVPKQPVSEGAAHHVQGMSEVTGGRSGWALCLLSFIPYGAGGRGLNVFLQPSETESGKRDEETM
jgi:hypothetical protein